MILAIATLLAAAPAQEMGARCTPCHSEHLEGLKAHKHFAVRVGCEVCHGSSQKHRDASGGAAPDRVAAPEQVPALCGGCHEKARREYSPSRHGKVVLAAGRLRAASCGTCHGVHEPRSIAAMKRQCDRCHSSLPAACQVNRAAQPQALPCAGCHDLHTLAKR
jgi:hypothetical protein